MQLRELWKCEGTHNKDKFAHIDSHRTVFPMYGTTQREAEHYSAHALIGCVTTARFIERDGQDPKLYSTEIVITHGHIINQISSLAKPREY